MPIKREKNIITPPADAAVNRRRVKKTAKKETVGEMSGNLYDLISDLKIHQFELETQNRELLRIQEELESSRRGYSDLYDFAPIGYFTFNAEGLIQEVNLMGARLLNSGKRLLPGTPFSCFVAREDRDIFRRHLNAVIRKQKQQTCELRVIRENGPVMYAQLHSTVAESSGNKPVCCRTAVIEITEQRNADEALKRQLDFQQALLDAVPIPVYYKDDSCRYLGCNAAFEKHTGIEKEKIIGRTVYEIVPGEFAGECDRRDQDLLKRGGEQVYEAQGADSSGIVRNVIFHKARFCTGDGRIGGLIGAVIDVTVRNIMAEELNRYKVHLEILVKERTAELRDTVDKLKSEIAGRARVEEALKRNRLFLKSVFDSIQDGITVLDADRNILLVNKTIEQWYSHAMPIGYKLRKCFDAYHGRTEPCENCPATKAMEEKTLQMVVQPISKKEGGQGWIEMYSFPFLDDTGTVIGVVEYARDITDRRRMEEELLRASQLESINLLAGGIAHDLNNTLTGIILHIALARHYADPGDAVYPILTEAEAICSYAKGLPQQLLSFSKGGLPVKKLGSIGEMLEDTVSFSLSGSPLSFSVSLEDDLRPAEFDAVQISQVVGNLVINAREAMPGGGSIEVNARNCSIERGSPLPLKEGNYLHISVTDHGIGIQGENIARVFEPFFTTKARGSGLGLATAYSIVKMHNGHIDAQSREGEGTTFSFYLPASEEPPPLSEGDTGSVAGGTGKILIMDDEAIILHELSRLLHRSGYEVQSASDGAGALALYREALEKGRPFDAVLLDLTVRGGMGGKECFDELRILDPGVKAIITSGYSEEPLMSDYREYGFRDVVRKPYTIEDLSLSLARVISGGEL